MKEHTKGGNGSQAEIQARGRHSCRDRPGNKRYGRVPEDGWGEGGCFLGLLEGPVAAGASNQGRYVIAALAGQPKLPLAAAARDDAAQLCAAQADSGTWRMSMQIYHAPLAPPCGACHSSAPLQLCSSLQGSHRGAVPGCPALLTSAHGRGAAAGRATIQAADRWLLTAPLGSP